MEANKKKELWRAVKFTLFSASAGLIEAGSIFLLEKLTPLSSDNCYLIGLVLSVLWNFTFNRKFTFKSASNVPVAMLKVAAYYAVFTPLSKWAVKYLTGTVGWSPVFCHRIPLSALFCVRQKPRHSGEEAITALSANKTAFPRHFSAQGCGFFLHFHVPCDNMQFCVKKNRGSEFYG